MSTYPFDDPPPDYAVRLHKLEQLKSLDIDPYPHTSEPTHTLESLHATLEIKKLPPVDSLNPETTPLVLAGRVLLHRHMGKIIFIQIQEGMANFQLIFLRGNCCLEPLNVAQSFEIIKKIVDLGDWIEATGHLCQTKKEEPSLLVSSFRILCKSLLPLPDKHNKLTSKELILRKRWLDLITNPKSFRRFEMRFQIIRAVRHFFENEDFLEVETPILQSHYGGAEAKPFVTNVSALKQNVFLRISLELSLKKLLVGGMRRIFELNKVFRNEGIDRSHNPEFTLLEAYAAYWDYNKMMDLVERLFIDVAQKIRGTTVLKIQGQDIDLGKSWKRMTMKESIQLYAGFNVDKMENSDLIQAIESCDGSAESSIRGLLIAQLFEVAVEKYLIEPHHILDHPIETTPLCKPIREPQDPRDDIYVERFESFLGGEEICNSYSELNDPILQNKLFQEQKTLNKEKNEIDLEFLESIYQGMPPAGGIGIGIDRMVMFLTESAHIKDVLFFPMMRSI